MFVPDNHIIRTYKDVWDHGLFVPSYALVATYDRTISATDLKTTRVTSPKIGDNSLPHIGTRPSWYRLRCRGNLRDAFLKVAANFLPFVTQEDPIAQVHDCLPSRLG